jgi:hypothetical protein
MLYNLSEEALFRQHRRCFDNKRYALLGKGCGCFYCLRHFDVSEITHWYESEKEKTASCPYCSIDAVIIETENEHVEHDLLCQLNMRFFNTAPVEWSKKPVIFDDLILSLKVKYEKSLAELISSICNDDYKPYGRDKTRFYTKPWSSSKSSRLFKTLILRV